MFIKLDYIAGGKLLRTQPERGRYTEPEARFFAAQVTLALEVDGLAFRLVGW